MKPVVLRRSCDRMLADPALHWGGRNSMSRDATEALSKGHEQSLRKHLLELLGGGGAHAKFEDVVKDLPAKLRGAKPAKYPHTPWMLLEHLRLAQWDILDFSRNAKHVSPEWPGGY